VNTPPKSVTPIVDEALLLGSDTLVAVMVTTPAIEGAVKLTGVPERLFGEENDPPAVEPVEVNVHLTPWFAESLLTVAVTPASTCDTVNPVWWGTTSTVIVLPEACVVAIAAFENPLTLFDWSDALTW